MSTYVNLMSDRTRVRECMRSRIRQWTWVLSVTTAVLTLHLLTVWWPVRDYARELETLEAQYEPVREMKRSVGELNQRVVATTSNYQFELAFARDTPLLTLVGLLSQAVSQSKGEVFLERIDYRQDGLPGNSSETLSIVGIARYSRSVEKLAEKLRIVVPNSESEVRSIESIEVNRHPMLSFLIDCTLP